MNTPSLPINNEIYDHLGERWYTADDDPIALLRAEAAFRTPWLIDELAALGAPADVRVLDIGCGGGFASNALAAAGHRVTGIDMSTSSLGIARRHDATGTVDYREANAYQLPFADGTFDAACALDVLEHVDRPDRLIAEAARVLRPGGRFFFYTFNRTLLSRIMVIEAVERFVDNVPERLHLFEMFIKPNELERMCEDAGLQFACLRGVRPCFSLDLLRLVWTGKVPSSFRFTFTRSLNGAYLGYATRNTAACLASTSSSWVPA